MGKGFGNTNLRQVQPVLLVGVVNALFLYDTRTETELWCQGKVRVLREGYEMHLGAWRNFLNPFATGGGKRAKIALSEVYFIGRK